MSLTSWRRHAIGLSILRVLRPAGMTSYEFSLHHLAWFTVHSGNETGHSNEDSRNNYRGTSPTISTNRAGGEQRALLSDEVISDWSRHALVTYQETSRSKAEIRDERSALKPPVFNLQGCFRQAAGLAKQLKHIDVVLKNSHFPFFLSLYRTPSYSPADVLCVDEWASLTRLAKVNIFWAEVFIIVSTF